MKVNENFKIGDYVLAADKGKLSSAEVGYFRIYSELKDGDTLGAGYHAKIVVIVKDGFKTLKRSKTMENSDFFIKTFEIIRKLLEEEKVAALL